MEITTGIEMIDRALYLKKQKVLILADLHLGHEESLQRQGVLVPKQQLKETLHILRNIIRQVPKIKTVIINGDLKHEFGRITNQEWSEITKCIDFLVKHCDELLVIKGNHDKILAPIVEKKKIKLIDEYRKDGILITHGDVLPDKLEKTIIIGHEHPAVTLRLEGRAEKYKCFLRGSFKRKILIVQPSFDTLTQGTDMIKEARLSPFLQGSLKNYRVYILADKVYDFGHLKKLEAARWN